MSFKVTRIDGGVVVQSDQPIDFDLLSDEQISQMFVDKATAEQAALGLSSGGLVEVVIPGPKDPATGQWQGTQTGIITRDASFLKSYVASLKQQGIPVIYIGALGSYKG